ncbi:MAG TPA: DeoR/GlpR family DNA-binding transcription regulator [Firmicutes bacterium]|nr:DeoR/GlpR family DNA-binding transcription regulator [Bacillota bacterium]
MFIEERFNIILAEVEKRKAVSVTQLCQATGASEATIRRDLTALAAQGRLSKVHGGAVALDGEFENEEKDVSVKEQLYIAEKVRIAQYAAAQIHDEDFVFIDAGTTTIRMVDYLSGSRATFITNGIECARRLVEKGLKSYVVGGLLKPGTQAIVGAAAMESLSRYNLTKAFLGTNGVSVRQGFTTPDAEEAAIKTKAVQQAYMSYMLADSSKFGKVTAVTICPLDQACLITDHIPDSVYRQHTVIKEV